MDKFLFSWYRDKIKEIDVEEGVVWNIKNMRNERDSIARLIVLELYERGDIHLIQKLEIEQYHNKRH